jgi:hypothetical protein
MKIAWTIMGLFSASLAFGQIETDRPDFTESPNVVPKGSVQFETGFVLEKATEDYCLAEYFTNTTLNTTLVRFGLTDKTELRLNWSIDQFAAEAIQERVYVAPCTSNGNYDSDTTIKQTGLSPIFVGFKHHIYDNDIISIGFLAHVYLPFTSTGEFKTSKYAPEFLLPIGLSVTDRFSVSVQPGMSWDGESESPTALVTTSLAYSVTDRLGAYVEPFVYIDRATDYRVNGGFTYLINDHFQWDASAGLWDASYANRHMNYFLSTGFSYLIL